MNPSSAVGDSVTEQAQKLRSRKGEECERQSCQDDDDEAAHRGNFKTYKENPLSFNLEDQTASV